MTVEMTLDTAAELNRLRWRCRRGLLELDYLLRDFLDQYGATLDTTTLADFTELLEHPDPILLGWLTGRASPEERRLTTLVARIRRSTTDAP